VRPLGSHAELGRGRDVDDVVADARAGDDLEPSSALITARVTGDAEVTSPSASRVLAISSPSVPMKGSAVIAAGTRASAAWQSA
jgi:hypothetical protein